MCRHAVTTIRHDRAVDIQAEMPHVIVTMDIRDLVLKNRSFRRFDESAEISRETLMELVELARFSPSGANLQPLRYVLVNDRERNAAVFSCLRWAGYLREWHGPVEGERPSAYIIILGDHEVAENSGVDHGIVAQSMMLGACAMGLGGCMIGSIDRNRLREVTGLPDRYEILLVLALGKPQEKVVLEDLRDDGSIRYYRDAADVHHVPKRLLRDLVLEIGSVE
jgi:nitroreductase